MKALLYLPLLLVLAACVGTPRQDAISRITLQDGMTREQDCDATFGDGRIDACLCYGTIHAAQSNNPALNAPLAEAAAQHFCPGEPVLRDMQPNPDAIINQHATDFTVTRNDARWLSVVYRHYYYPAGAAHGMTALEVLLYDKQAGRWLAQGEIVPPPNRLSAGKVLQERLHGLNASRYDGGLWLDDITPEKLFTPDGCHGCVLYPDEGGWKAVFGQYAIGPYALGMVEVPLGAAEIGR